MPIPFASRSRKFTAAVPVTPASTGRATAAAAAAPPLVEVKIADQDVDAATSSTTTAAARTPTRKVRHRQSPSAPPTTPMAPSSSSRELECDSWSSSTSSTPESTLVATNTTPTTIATLSAVSTKLLPSTTTKSSRNDEDNADADDELVARRTSTSTSTSSTTGTTTCNTTSEKVTPATIPSTCATDVDKEQQVQNSVDAPPSATKQEDDTDIKMADDDNKSSDHKKANDATDPTIVGGSSSPPTDLKMKDEDATVATAKTGGGSDDGDLLHSDQLFAFDPNSIDDVLNLSGNESEMMMVGPSPAKSSFGRHEQYAFHHHHQPYDEQEYYYPNPRHNPHEYSHHHQMGIVSPATATSMAPRYMAPASFATTGTPSADATRCSYDPNPPGTSFRDESAYLDRTEGATGENVAKFLPAWSPIKTPKPTKAQKKKLLTDTGTTVTVKIDGMEINDTQPSRPNPHPPIHHGHHHNHDCGNYGAMEPQVQYHHPSNRHTIVSVLHHSPPDSPTPSVSSTSILEAVLKVREEFSNDGGCDRLGTAPSICTINHDAGLHVYAPNPVVPIPHTIACGDGRDSRSGAVTDISVSSWSASRKTTPSTSTFDMSSGRVPTPNGTEGQFVDAHVPTFTNSTAIDIRALQIPLPSKEDSGAFRIIMSPLTIAGVEERTDGFEPNNGGHGKDNESATPKTSEYSKHVWSGVIDGKSDSPFKKIANAANGTRIAVSTSEGTKDVIHPSTLPAGVTGSSITGRAGGSKKKAARIKINIKGTGNVGAATAKTKVKAQDAPDAKSPEGSTTKATETEMRERKVPNEISNETSNMDPTKAGTPEKKEPPKKIKLSVKKSKHRPASTINLRTRGVKTDAVVVDAITSSVGNNLVIVATNVNVNASIEDKAESPVPKSSTNGPKKQLSAKNASKPSTGTKKTGQSNGRFCSVDGCPKYRQSKSNGMCRGHYMESQGLIKYQRPSTMKPAADVVTDARGDDDDDDDDIEETWRKIKPGDLVPNTRVLIAYKEKELFRATVREIPGKVGGKYRVHYDTFKKDKTYLVPFSDFRALLDEDNFPVEIAETPEGDEGIKKAYSVQVSVFSDGKTSISSIEADVTTVNAPAAIEADADLAIDLEWRQCLESLVSHQKQYGCLPPEGTKAYKWFVKQTYEYCRKKTNRRSSLTQNQIAFLEKKAGFVFRAGRNCSAGKRQHEDMANTNDEDRGAVKPKKTNRKTRKN